jgi:methionyl aminopeptidase
MDTGMNDNKPSYVIHTADEIAGIRIAARKASEVLDRMCRAVRPGMTTLELDELGGRLIAETGGESAFYNYRGYPAQTCISINDEVVHGIGRPDRTIQMGDIVSIDCGISLGGFIGDNARTVSVGPPSSEAADLLAVTEGSLMAAIEASVATNAVRDIGAAVEQYVTAAGLSVVRDFVGHGCGCILHEPPEVPNYACRKATVPLYPGMVLALEPMVNIGTHRVKVGEDGWTVTTSDGSLSAHFEHMVLITENEPEILTWLKNA